MQRQSDRNKRRRIAVRNRRGSRTYHQARRMNAWKNPHSEHAPLSRTERSARLFVKSNGQSQSDDFSRLFPARSCFFFLHDTRKMMISLSAFLSFLLFRFVSYSLSQKCGAVHILRVKRYGKY